MTRLEAWKRRTDWPLMVIAIGSLPILLLDLVRDSLPRADRLFADVVNLVVLVAFAVDYFVGLALATRRRRYVRTEWMSLVLVVVQGIALVPSLTSIGVLRVLRAGRAFRLAAVVARSAVIGGSAARRGRAMLRDNAGRIALGLAALTWLTSAAAFTVAEDVGEGRRIHSFFDALWWSLATITTVGYGDIYPVTVAGRLIGAFTMLVGISAFALVTAKVASFLVRPDPPASS